MKAILWLGVLTAVLGTGCSKQEEAKPATTNQAKVGENPLDAPADYLRTVTKAQQTAVKTVDTVSINQAIQMFNASEGRNPKDLNELVTMKYMPRLPEPPANMKFSYDATSGTVKIVPK
jgi:hypothetical protein